MAKVQHTCTGCVPIDASIIDVYVTLVETNKSVTSAEASRSEAEAARVAAETLRTSTFATDHGRAVADHSIAQSDHATAGSDHTSTVAATNAANAAAAVANAKAELVQARLDTADADHTRAEGDHSTAVSDHSTASSDHTTAQSDHTTAGTDHTRAESDHTTAASDHTASGTATAAATAAATLATEKAGLVQDKLDRADTDHTRAESDHTTAVSDHGIAGTDHSTATGDHTTASADHTLAGTDHTTAASDHTTAGSDHTLAASDHTTASADHTQALADHEVMAGYDTRLTNAETEVSQLQQKVVEKSPGVNLIDPEKITVGKALNDAGTISDSQTLEHSDYIPVNGNSIISNGWVTTYWPIHVYDASYNRIRMVTSQPYTYVAGDAYIRINFKQSDTQLCANYGSVLADYEPYNPIGEYVKELASEEDVNELQDTVYPTKPEFTVPQGCLSDVQFNELVVTPQETIEVNNVSEFKAALTRETESIVVVNCDIITDGLEYMHKDKIIKGNGHKFLKYNYAFTGESSVESPTHNAYPIQGDMITSAIPYPHFIDDKFNVHQWKKSIWFEATGQLTKSDGTEATASYGQYRLPYPNNFNYTAEELSGTYIQFFASYRSIVAKVDSIDENYIYFTTSSSLGAYSHNPNAEYMYNGKYTSFRIINLKSNTDIYFDSSYIYVPKSVSTLYYPGRLLNAVNGGTFILENAIIYSAINSSYHDCSFKLYGCELCYINTELFGGRNTRVELQDCYVHDTIGNTIGNSASENVIIGCTFKNTGKCVSSASVVEFVSGEYLVRDNKFIDFGYCAVRSGRSTSGTMPYGVIENNLIYQTPLYYKNARFFVPLDSGAIYIWTFNDKNFGAVVRGNIVHNYNGRGDNRGIFCDDGASYFYLYDNSISNTPNSYSIDARYASGYTATGYKDNNGKYIIGNYCDSNIRCIVGANSTDDISIAKGNTRLYGNGWGRLDNISAQSSSALYEFETTTMDKFGYFDADGLPHTSL